MIISFSRISSGYSGQSPNNARENRYRYQKFFKKSLITWGIGGSLILHRPPGFLARVKATPREDWSTPKPPVLGLDGVQNSPARIRLDWAEAKPYKPAVQYIPSIKIYGKKAKTEFSKLQKIFENSAEIKEWIQISKGSKISNFTSLEIFKASSESLDSNKIKTLLTEIRDLSTNPSFLSKSSLQKFNKNVPLFSYGKHSSRVRKDQISETAFDRTKISENQFKLGNRKKIFDWVCYSQSQYPVKKEFPFENKNLLTEHVKNVGVHTETENPSLLGLDKVQNTPASFVWDVVPIKPYKPGFDSFELVNINKTLFERQNILRCYKERNLLRLIVAFFDFSTGSGSFSGIDFTKTLTN